MAIINCYDVNGDAIRFLTQWDHDISIRATGVKTSPIPEFRFSNKNSQKSKCISGVVVGDGVKATIPNGFLQEALPIYVQLFYTYPSGDAKTEHTFVIPVKPASMPDGAVYEPVEVRSIVELEKRVKAMEENGVPGAGGIPSNPSFDTVSLGGDAGVVIIPEGTADAPAITFYGARGDEPVALNNVADATDDRSAPNLGQVKQLVGAHSGQNVELDTTLTKSGEAADAKATGDEIKRVESKIPSIEGLANKEDIPTKPEDIGAQPQGDYLTKAPVESVNGKTGAVRLGAADVGARPDTWMPTAQEVGALPSTYTPPNQTAEQVGADPKGTSASAVSAHNTNGDAHNDIRLEIKAIREQLAAFLDVDEETLNELSELIARIVANQTSIAQLTSGKVSVSDIIDNLTTNAANKPLSAAQGVALKGLVDGLSASLANYQPKGNYALASAVPTKVSQLTNDKGYLTEHQDISHLLPSFKIGVLSPDNYAGTDTQKLQSCLDAVKTAGGGIIAINRLYTLTGDLFVELESGKIAQITFLGIGQNAGINFKTYKFTSTTNRNNGNLLFDGMNLYGTAVGFDFDNLIRAKFSNCTISGFTNLVCSTTYIQTLHMVNCQIRRTAGAVIKSGKTTGDTSASAGTVMDMHITGCLIEWCAGLLDTYGVSGSSIIGCCIEGFSGTPIVVTGYASGMVIDGNYWEKNGNGINIDLSSMTGECQLTISNNSFSEYYNQAAGIVHLPSSIAGGILQITGNKAAAYEVLLYVPDDAIDLRTTVWAFANGGSARDPNSALKTTEPYDLVRAVAKADEVFELTDSDKEEIVNDTLAALSGEEWEFTMDDGSVVKRTVATAHLTDFNQEGWDFVLTDGTIISKVVATA